MNKSQISWTEATWSPVTGCNPISAGCKHCYAKREVEARWSKNPKSVWYGRAFNDLQCHPDALKGANRPMRAKKPRRIFVCPRADLFHDAVPTDFLDEVFAAMAMAPQHTFQVLTKRPERMLAYFSDVDLEDRLSDIWRNGITNRDTWCLMLPLTNVWLGVSVENQATADERIPLLLQTPAAVRWVSAEPLLGPVDLLRYLDVDLDRGLGEPWLDWVVAGGESGPLARPMHPAWARGLRDQCKGADVPFLFKQWGEWISAESLPSDIAMPAKKWANVDKNDGSFFTWQDGGKRVDDLQAVVGRVGVRKAGRLLDGELYDAYPRAAP